MNVTSKSRYALKIMIDLANSMGAELVRRNDIAQRQGIPLKYLDQIMIRLRQKDLVTSSRGRSGGYLLSRPPTMISVWDIFTAAEDSVFPVMCLEEAPGCECAGAAICTTRLPWHVIYDAVERSLSEITLDRLVEAVAAMNENAGATATLSDDDGSSKLARQLCCSARGL